MKTILASTYALNPYKGSEDGMGWNFINQIAKLNKVITITRKNNREHIEKYMTENPSDIYKNITFKYYDLPYILRFWKKGSRGAMLYYMLWQFGLVFFVKKEKLKFDITHAVNFHNDWTFSLLSFLGKPMVWGPVGHHPSIPKQFVLPTYGKKAYLKERATWFTKKYFWNFAPLLHLTKKRAKHIWCMNTEAAKVLNLKNNYSILPSVASEKTELANGPKKSFKVLSVGRLVPLKGFDVTIKSFAQFYNTLNTEEKNDSELIIVGSGPEQDYLKTLCKKLNIEKATTFINWIERSKLASIYQEASVFLFPSHEGAGMVVAEALSYGLPVLCFENCGPGEFVTETCGIKTPYSKYETSVNMFSNNLKELKNKPAMLSEMSNKAIERFNTYFNWDLRANQLNAVYQTL